MGTTKIPENFPDHGNSKDWAELTEEEKRCLKALAKYFKIFECRAEPLAMELAWIDLKREFVRLEGFPWFNLGPE